MGYDRSSPSDWAGYSSTLASKPRAAIFTSTTGSTRLSPIAVRESVDSPNNPEATPVIIFVDETGSMGSLAEAIIKTELTKIATGIYTHKPISDPHILVGGIGDAYADRYPLQPTQFEAEAVALNKQIEEIFLEGNGGANRGESYSLAWYFAAYHTKIDSMIKRGKKGYLFTIGDEPVLPTLTKAQIKAIFGDEVESDMDFHELFAAASEFYEVFHIRVNNRYPKDSWTEVMGERVIDVFELDKMADVITSTMRLIEGEDRNKIIASHATTGSALVVAAATKDLVARKGSEVVQL